MFFYEDFIKKVENTKVDVRRVRKFSLETKSKVLRLGIAIPMLIVGVIDLSLFNEIIKLEMLEIVKRIVITALVLYIGFKKLKEAFSYRIKIDSETKKFISGELKLDFDEIERCELKESVVGKTKRIQTIIRFVTKDKREIIIPLIMNKKVEFVSILKNLLDDKFYIIKK